MVVEAYPTLQLRRANQTLRERFCMSNGKSGGAEGETVFTQQTI